MSRLNRGVIVGAVVWLGLGAACSDPAPADSLGPDTTAAPITILFVPEAQVAPRTSPPPKPTTTTTTTTLAPTVATATDLPLPEGFPDDLALPEGNVGYYTGSPDLGFHVNVSTAYGFSDLVHFFDDAISANPAWDISVRDVGLGFVPGLEGRWAYYTSSDHVLTQLTGEYPGVIEIEDRHVNILLDAPVQPEAGVEPEIAPPAETIARPETEFLGAHMASGIIELTYAAEPGVFETLITEYRLGRWTELSVTGFNSPVDGFAVGELLGWKITVQESLATGRIELKLEDVSLSYP